MHNWAKSMADCLKAKVEEIGVSNIDGEMLCDLEKWSKVICNIAQFDKDYKIVEAMEDADSQDIVDMADERRYYRGQPRTASGRFKRRAYTGDQFYYDGRDMDRGYGRMYYSGDDYRGYGVGYNTMNDEPITAHEVGDAPVGTRMNRQYDSRMGRSGISRRTYMESKDMGKDEDKKMKDLDKYLEELKDDMKEMVQGMTTSEKSMWQNRLMNMANSL